MGKVTHGSKKKKSGWDGRRKAVSAMAVFMALLFLIPLVMEIFQYAGAVTLDEISGLCVQQEELETKKSGLQSQLNDLKGKEDSAVSRCNLLGEKVTVLEDQIATTQGMVDEYAAQIKTHQKQLKKAKKKEAGYYDLFCQRVRSMEEASSVSYWQILFGASGFSDFLDRVSFVSNVMEYDDSVLQELEQAKKTVAKETKALEEKKTAKQGVLGDLKGQKRQMKTTSAEAATALKEIKSNQDVYADQLAEVDSLADELASDIVTAKSDYAAEQKAAAEQAAKEAAAAKKAAEKAKKREEAKKNQANTANQGNSGKQEGTSDKQEGTKEEDSKKENDTTEKEEEKPAANPASGAAIVNYAMQFIGGKYVWGGSNLSTGVDCSGFVMCVYDHFGYSLPHSSAILASCGKGVGYSNAQMGDVICYNGHCGIYIGGGKMVNALGAKYGIVVSNVNTGRLVAVRRII